MNYSAVLYSALVLYWPECHHQHKDRIAFWWMMLSVSASAPFQMFPFSSQLNPPPLQAPQLLFHRTRTACAWYKGFHSTPCVHSVNHKVMRMKLELCHPLIIIFDMSHMIWVINMSNKKLITYRCNKHRSWILDDHLMQLLLWSFHLQGQIFSW